MAFNFISVKVSATAPKGYTAQVSLSPPRGGLSRVDGGAVNFEAIWLSGNVTSPVRVTIELVQDDVAAEPFNAVASVAIAHKLTIDSSSGTKEIPALNHRVFVVDDDSPGVVSMTPDVFRAFELRAFEGDDEVRITQRYELRALQCRADANGRAGPIYDVKPMLFDLATNMSVPADVAEFRLYQVAPTTGELVRVAASTNGTATLGGDIAQSPEHGCRVVVELVIHRDFKATGERLFVVRHVVTSRDERVAPLLANTVCPLIGLPRDIAVIVVDADQANVDVVPRFERVQVVEGRISGAYSMRLTKRPLFPVRVAVRVDKSPTSNNKEVASNGVISGGIEQVEVEPRDVVFTPEDWSVFVFSKKKFAVCVCMCVVEFVKFFLMTILFILF